MAVEEGSSVASTPTTPMRAAGAGATKAGATKAGTTGADPTEEQLAVMFTGLNEVIRAGEEMRRLRAEMIRLLAGAGWTQDRLARLAGMSQPAVSKQVTGSPGAASDTGGLALDQEDAPWLEGRLWGLAEAIAEEVAEYGESRESTGPAGGGTARSARLTQALARGRKRFTERNVDALRRLVEEDLRTHRAALGPRHQEVREAYDRIARALDTGGAAGPYTEGTAPARRALARQVQRMRLRQA
jgi:transcriptional regulator with XRE-family HTH domain